MNRLKHWQIFLLFFLPIFVGLHFDGEYKTLLNSISLAFIMIYYFAAGEFLSETTVGGHLFFQINCVFLTVAVLAISNGLLELVSDNVILVIAIMGYSLLALIQVIDHLAILIRLREGKDVNDYKQKVEFILLLLWPVGIWFLQPRINKIR